MTLLLRRKWLILGTFLGFAAIAVPLIWLLFAPTYRATAVIRISPVIEPIVFKNERSGVLPFYQSFVNTEVSVIYSPTVLERVLDQDEIQQTRWVAEQKRLGYTMLSAIMQRMQKALSVSPRVGTELIDVSMATESPKDAMTIVNTVVLEYKKLKEELDKQGDVQLAETLAAEQKTLDSEIKGLITTRFNVASPLGTDAPEELRSTLSQQLSVLEAELHNRERELELANWQLESVAKQEESVSTMPADAPDRRYVRDQGWQQLYFDVERAKSDLAVARERFGELNPRLKEAVARAQLAEDLLRKRQDQLDELWASNPGQAVESGDIAPAQTLEQKQAELAKQIELLKKDLTALQKKVKEAGDIALQIASYDEQIRQKRELAEAVRSRREILEMEGKAPARIRVVAMATQPASPSNDRRLLLSLVAICASLGGAVAIGYLRSLADKRIYDVKELQRLSQVPFLGLLPKLSSAHLPKELGGAGLQPGDNDAGAGRLMLMENMRMVRTTLLERVSQTGERVMLVTSSLPHTGKSSVAVLLAQSLAVVGKKVLLVEADLRRPVLSGRLGVTTGKGLATLLAGRAKDEEVIAHPEAARFDLVPAGDVPEEFDPELLANGVFSRCMSRWKEEYDFILMDSPPLLRVADAQILASSADGTIMVLRSSHDRRTETLESLAQLSAVGGALLGTVLIGGNYGPGYGGRSYPYYSGYGKSYGYGFGRAKVIEATTVVEAGS